MIFSFNCENVSYVEVIKRKWKMMSIEREIERE